MIDGEVTSTEDKDTLIDTLNLTGGDDEYNEREVIIYDATGDIVDGETGVVSDFAAATYEATLSANLSANITDGDKYELWKTPWKVADINDAINQAIIEVTGRALVDRQTDSNFTRENEYIYDWLVPYAFGNDFRLLSKVEYVETTGVEKDIHMCEVVWDEDVDAEVTETVDTTYNIEGTYCLKIVVGADAEANDVLITDSFTSLDISDCDKVEITVRSSAALSAGDIQLLLDDTAKCVSATESLDIPATLANTTTTHVIDLANPHSDTAIISVGIKLITDAANTMYFDRIKAVKSASKQYKILTPEYWSIVKGTTPKLALTTAGLATTGLNTQVRLTGYAAPDIFSGDSTDSEIDPGWLINKVCGELLLNHAKSQYLDIHDRFKIGTLRLAMADRQLSSITTSLVGTTKVI